MFTKISNEDLINITGIYQKILEHPFWKFNNKTVKMLDEFDELFEQFRRVLTKTTGYDLDTHKNIYKYSTYEHIQMQINCGEGKSFWSSRCVDIWTIPSIGIIYNAFHDYRSYKSLLKFAWEDESKKNDYLNIYMEYCDALLRLYKKTIDGELVETFSFPKIKSGEKTTRKYVLIRNPKYNNYWTFPEYL